MIAVRAQAAQQSRVRVRAVLEAGAASVLALAALAAQQPSPPAAVPLVVVVLSLAAIGGAMLLPAPFHLPSLGDGAPPGSWRSLGVSALLMVVPALGAAGLSLQEPFSAHLVFVRPSSTWAAVLWLAGIGAALLYAFLHDRTPDAGRGRAYGRSHRPVTLPLLALAVILVVAAALRFWQLGTLPAGINFDEADPALSARALLHMPFQPLAPWDYGHEVSLYYYALALLFHFAGSGIVVARTVSVTFALIGIAGVYYAGKLTGGTPLALLGSALVAVSRWSLHFSRFAEPNIAAPAMLALCAASLICALRRPQLRWFLVSGSLLGWTTMSYLGAQLPVAVLGGTACAIVLLQPRLRAAAWPAVLALPLAMIVAAAPLLVMMHLDLTYTLWRAQGVAVSGATATFSQRMAVLAADTHLYLEMFTVAGDRFGADNLPWQPLLDTVTGACFLLGLGMSLRRAGQWFYQLLLLWLCAGMLNGLLSSSYDAPSATRTLGILPAVALIAALPLCLLGRMVFVTLARSFRGASPVADQRRRARFVAAAVVAVAPILALSQTVQAYFIVYAHNLPSWEAMDGPLTELGRTLPGLARQGYQISVNPEALYRAPVLEYVAGWMPAQYDPAAPVQPSAQQRDLAIAVPIHYQPAVVPAANYREVLADLRLAYPHARVLSLTPSFDPGVVEYAVVLIPARDAAHYSGLTVQFTHPTLLRAHLEGPLRWPVGSDAHTTATIRASLLITADQAGRLLRFRLAGARYATVRIDGATTGSAQGDPRGVRLSAGVHRLVAQGSAQPAAPLHLQWLVAGQGWTDLPPRMLVAPSTICSSK